MKKNISKIILGAILMSFININPIYAFEKTNVSITLNNMLQPVSSSVINKNGYTLVSFRELFNMLNIDVDWNGVKRIITAKKGDTTLIINVDTNNATINGKKTHMPIGAEIIDGSTFVPLRFACEAFNMEIIWEAIEKNIVINTKDNGYIFLDDYYKNTNDNGIPFDKALDMAIDNSLDIKKNDERLALSNEQLKESKKNLNNIFKSHNLDMRTYYATSSALYKNEQEVKDIEDDKKIIKDNIKLSLLSKIIDIKTVTLDKMIAKNNLDIQKTELENAKLKYKYGLISKNKLDSVSANIKTNEKLFENMEDNLTDKQNDLKDFLNKSNYIDVLVDLNADFSDIDDIDIDKFLLQEPEGNISIHMLQRDMKTQETILKKYTYDTSNIDDIQNSQQIKSIQRRIDDAKEDMGNKIKDNYKRLLDLKDSHKDLEKSLQEAISQYNVIYANYINGETTMLELEKAKLNILEVETNIEKNKMRFNISLYKFYNPHI